MAEDLSGLGTESLVVTRRDAVAIVTLNRPHKRNALDDATDELYAHRRAPGAVFWLATDNVNALYWSLHDWSHFHNHGSFDDRPATEYQCDVAALAWLWINRDVIPLPAAHWERLREASLENHRRLRAERPVTACPPPALLEDGAALRALAARLTG